MTKEREIEKLENITMMFQMSLGEYGNLLNIDLAFDPNVKIALMSMQRILVECSEELDKQIEMLKK